MKKQKLVSLFLLSALLASCGQSAGDAIQSSSAGTDTTEPPETEPEYVYPDEDYGGYEFVFLNQELCSWASRLCVPEETTGDIINDAISERFNIKISEYNVTKNEIPTLARNDVMAGDDTYDCIFCPIDNLISMITDGIFVDLLTVDSLNLDQPWWDNKVVESATLRNQCYFASSDIFFHPFEATWIIYFNEDRFDALNIDYPYDEVRSGRWTIDRLYEICRLGASLNG